MKRRDMFFAAVIIAIILFLLYLSTIGRKAPAIPADAAHVKITDQRACLDCHAPGKISPLKHDHPPKEMCFTCHKRGGSR
jgi:hypothetical protein